MRTCIHCGQPFTPTTSGNGSPGSAKLCGDACRSARRKAMRKIYNEREKERQREYAKQTEKPCKTCREVKPLSEYYKHRDGYRALCKVCYDKQYPGQTYYAVPKPKPEEFRPVMQVDITGVITLDRRREVWPWLA